MKKTLAFLLALILVCSNASAVTYYSWRYRTHATDCTALTDGKSHDLCYEADSQNYYTCVPSAGDCSGSEWKLSPNIGAIGLLSTVDISANTNLAAGRSLTLSGDSVEADAELYTDSKCVYIQNPTSADDLKSIWRSKIASTLTSLWAESDQTVTFMLQVDDGTPADVDSVDLAPAAGVAEDTSLNGDATMGAGDRLDIDLVSVSGTPTWCAICWTLTYDD